MDLKKIAAREFLYFACFFVAWGVFLIVALTSNWPIFSFGSGAQFLITLVAPYTMVMFTRGIIWAIKTLNSGSAGNISVKHNRNQFVVIVITMIILIPLICIGIQEAQRLNNMTSAAKNFPQLLPVGHSFDEIFLPERRNRMVCLITLLSFLMTGSGTLAVFWMEGKKEGKKPLPKPMVFGALIIIYALLCIVFYKGWEFYSVYFLSKG